MGGSSRTYSLLLKSDELPASSQAVRVDSKELSRSAVAAGGIWNVLPIREKRRVIWTNASAVTAHERRAPVHDTGAVRGRVQRRERNVSELFQAFRDREISHALLDARSRKARPEICR